jgi:atlastin
MFQKLVFLVRDFQWVRDFPLGYSDDRSPEPNFYKSRLLPDPRKGDEQNYIREQIGLTFPQVAAYLLPYPGNGLAVRDRLDNLDEEFAEFMQKFVETTFLVGNLIPKNIGGAEVTGVGFKPFISSWASLFSQNNGLPTIHSIYDTTAEVQHDLAMKNALAFYDNEMKKTFDSNIDGIPGSDLADLHTDFRTNSVAIFKSMKKIGGRAFEEKFLNGLELSLVEQLKKYQKINKDRREAAEFRRKAEEEKERLESEIAKSKVNAIRRIPS